MIFLVWKLHTVNVQLILNTNLLKLNWDKALAFLKWDSTLYYIDTINLVSKWYDHFYNFNDDKNLYDFTLNQISKYESIAIENNKSWTK